MYDDVFAGASLQKQRGHSMWLSWAQSSGGTWSRMLKSCRIQSGQRAFYPLRMAHHRSPRHLCKERMQNTHAISLPSPVLKVSENSTASTNLYVISILLQGVPAAHRGFLTRARSVSIETLYEHACRQKKRLVLSGDTCSTTPRTHAAPICCLAGTTN